MTKKSFELTWSQNKPEDKWGLKFSPLFFVFSSLERLVYSFPQATFATWWSNHINWHSGCWWKVDDDSNALNHKSRKCYNECILEAGLSWELSPWPVRGSAWCVLSHFKEPLYLNKEGSWDSVWLLCVRKCFIVVDLAFSP